MINAKSGDVAWISLITELDEAREHLEKLIKEMHETGAVDDSVYEATLGHIAAHLNRAWHSRNQATEITEEQWDQFSQYPKDLKPVG
jgi:galactokinase/mevalonate kinase-like predicted kinase